MKLSEKLALAEAEVRKLHRAVTAIANGEPVQWTAWVSRGFSTNGLIVRYGVIGEGYRAIRVQKGIKDAQARSAGVSVVEGAEWVLEPCLDLIDAGIAGTVRPYMEAAESPTKDD